MRRNLIAILAVALLGSPVAALAAGLTGQCVDCHTMHNSELGAAVAVTGLNDVVTQTPIPNLLRMDCIACHAAEPNGPDKIVNMGGGSAIPQVWHDDATGNLAAGNFRYIAESGARKGHNVTDLVAADSGLSTPPGFRHADGVLFQFDVTKFTCAGSMGCHGMRGQLLDEGDEFLGIDPVYRTGLSAFSGWDGSGAVTSYFSGAHHRNYDGVKSDSGSAVVGLPGNPDFFNDPLAHSYRFIRSLRGAGNEIERWQNNSADSHNEYAAGYVNNTLRDTNYGTTTNCTRCHTGGQGGMTTRLTVPSSSMSGFCITCHSVFHSSGATNGTSGAFLRHPSDWVIPDSSEYAAYTSYKVSAPVGRPLANFNYQSGYVQSNVVNPGEDMVMCLSCHVAHASPYDSMLRFDYAAMTAGNATTGLGEGCLACHTTKGLPKADN